MYITESELKELLSPDGTPSGAARTPASLPDAQLTEAIEWAQAEVDTRLATRYAVPFADPAPQTVRWLVFAIAAYHAWLTYRKTVDLEERDPVQLRYNTAINLLNAVVDGRADLPGADATAAEGVGSPLNRLSYDLFTEQTFGLRPASGAEGAERRVTTQFWGWPHGV